MTKTLQALVSYLNETIVSADYGPIYLCAPAPQAWIDQHVNAARLPAIWVWGIREKMIHGEMGNSASLHLNVKLSLYNVSNTAEKLTFDERKGIFPLSDLVKRTLLANKSLNGAVTGLDLDMDIIDVQKFTPNDTQYSLGRIFSLIYKRDGLPWSGYDLSERPPFS
jgi:hypothetical protein